MARSKTFIEVTAVLYLCLTFALLIVQGTVTYIDAAYIEIHKASGALSRPGRPYIWMVGGFECFLYFIHMLLIGVWLFCMYKDNHPGMVKILIGISVRVIGSGLFSIYEMGKRILVKVLFIHQMELYQATIQIEAARQVPAEEAFGDPAQPLPATTADAMSIGTVVAIPVPEAETRTLNSAQSMRPLTATTAPPGQAPGSGHTNV